MRKLPSSDKEFEKLVRDCVAYKYTDYYVLYGRKGQTQHGADILSSNRMIVVQCKFYDVNKVKSYDSLQKETSKDFYEALDSFPQMVTFVVATSLENDTHTLDFFSNVQETAKKKTGRDIVIEFLFWSDIVDLCDKCETTLTADEYALDYTEPLFLHRNNTAVCLRNLFVPQKYLEHSDYTGNGKDKDNLLSRIGSFVQSSERQFLFIEGDAGCGKTSLVQSLCWHYKQDDATSKAVLNDRPLLVIRLRDLNREKITEVDGLLPAILDDIGIAHDERISKRKANLLRRFPRAVLVLEGFDELCIIERFINYENLLYKLSRERLEDWRIIVTSRPNYIGKGIDVPHYSVELRHFDGEKRREWIERYTSPTGCNLSLGEDLVSYILNPSMTAKESDGERNWAEGVYDTPLMLYLLSTNNVSQTERENPWLLYHRLFSEDILDRRYDSQIHPRWNWGKAAYYLAEEISYEMYCTGSEQVLLDEGTVSNIVKKLHQNSVLRDGLGAGWEALELVKRNTGLCSYWKVREDRGFVEFYHNNIRDFFLSERVFDGLNHIYTNDKTNREEKVNDLIRYFISTCRYGLLSPIVIFFLYHRARNCKANNTIEFPTLENDQKLFPMMFQKLVTDGRVFNELNEVRLFRTISSIVGCASAVYRTIWDAYHNSEELFVMWKDASEIRESDIFINLVPVILGRWVNPLNKKCQAGTRCFDYQSPVAFAEVDLSTAELIGVDLRGADLTYACLMSSILREARMDRARLCYSHLEEAMLQDTVFVNADLQKANLSNAVLQRSDLRNANLQFAIMPNVDLRNANLSGANLRGADLKCADCKDADLHDTVMQGTDMRAAELIGANLAGADLQDADLECSKLRGADLRKANLGYARLIEANLEGANLQGANLRYAELNNANLQGANLRDADLSNAHIHCANLCGADFHNTKFQNTDILHVTLDDDNIKDTPLGSIDISILTENGVVQM